jgi:hypothetical protein
MEDCRQMMTTKERILTALRGGMPDRIPWAPRWEMWYNAVKEDGRLPEKYRGWDLFEVARDLGFGLKGIHASCYAFELQDVEVSTKRRVLDEGTYTITKYYTPYGDLQRVYFVTPELADQGVGGRVVQPFLVDGKGYDAARYVVEHTKVKEKFDRADDTIHKVGDDGLAFGSVLSCPVHRYMREWTTYEQSYYELNDYPNEVDRLTEAIEAQEWEMVRLAGESPLEMIALDGNYDYELTPPPLYRQYFLPFHQKAVQHLHERGKLVCSHCDGDSHGLLELIKASGFDVAEAWTPAPMTPVRTAEARAVWGTQIAFWGGLSTTVLSDSFPEREFDSWFARLLLDVAPGNGLVLGTGDNIPTDSSWERIAHLNQMVEEYCRLPLDVERLKVLAGE